MRKTTKTTILSSMICLMAGFLFFSSCKDDEGKEPEPGLSISAIEPATARVGEEVVITGTGFHADFTQNVVEFTGSPASVKAGSKTSLTVSVPAGAETGPITVKSNGQSVTSSVVFTLEATVIIPELIDVFPDKAIAGAEVTIAASGLGEDVANIQVVFGGENVEVLSLKDDHSGYPKGTQLVTVKVPSLPEGEVQISLSIGERSASTTLPFYINPIPKGVNGIYYRVSWTLYKGVINEEGVSSVAVWKDGPVMGAISVNSQNHYLYWLHHHLERAPLNNASLETTEVVYDMREKTSPYKGIRGNFLELGRDNQFLYLVADSSGHEDAGMADYSVIVRAPLDGSGVLTPLYTFKREMNFDNWEIEGNAPKGIAVDDARIYFGIYNNITNQSSVVYGSLDGSAATTTLYTIDGANITGLTLNASTGKLLVATDEDKIYIGNTDGSGGLSALITERAHAVDNIRIDETQGHIYWLSRSNGDELSAILRARMDGSQIEVLFESNEEISSFGVEVGIL